MPRRLIIDASIARASSGEHAVYPTSMRCRDCLMEISDHRHRMVMTPELRAEWDRHQSNFALQWRASMQRRGRVIPVDAALDDKLRDRIEAIAETEQQREAIAKDLHLVAAARLPDRTILSLDEAMRHLLRRASRQVRELRPIVWANPDREEEAVPAWIRTGARSAPQRRLGHQNEP